MSDDTKARAIKLLNEIYDLTGTLQKAICLITR